MKTTVVQVLKKQNVLLTVLFGGVLTFALPATVQTTARPEALHQKRTCVVGSAPFTFFAEDHTAGVPQLERNLSTPLFYSLLQKLNPDGWVATTAAFTLY